MDPKALAHGGSPAGRVGACASAVQVPSNILQEERAGPMLQRMKSGRRKGHRVRTRRHQREPGAGGSLEGVFASVVETVHRRWVLPHCRDCARPCCNLDSLVLELDWRQLRLLWGIRKPRREFDARLAQGKGPTEVRTQEGMYYVHKRVCPAYQDRICSVYGSDLKPAGCTDFPLYVDDGGGLLADLRCEALSLDRVEEELQALLPPAVRVHRRRNPEFPFLVTFRIAQQGALKKP